MIVRKGPYTYNTLKQYVVEVRIPSRGFRDGWTDWIYWKSHYEEEHALDAVRDHERNGWQARVRFRTYGDMGLTDEERVKATVDWVKYYARKQREMLERVKRKRQIDRKWKKGLTPVEIAYFERRTSRE